MLVMFATLALASDPGMEADARCLHVLSAVGTRIAPEPSGAGAASSFYFAGKMRGRDPAVDIAAAVRQARAAAKATGVDGRAELARCTAELRSTIAPVAAVRREAQDRPASRAAPDAG